MGGTVKAEAVLGSHWMLNPQPAASPHSKNTKKGKHTKHLSKFKSQKTHTTLVEEENDTKQIWVNGAVQSTRGIRHEKKNSEKITVTICSHVVFSL